MVRLPVAASPPLSSDDKVVDRCRFWYTFIFTAVLSSSGLPCFEEQGLYTVHSNKYVCPVIALTALAAHPFVSILLHPVVRSPPFARHRHKEFQEDVKINVWSPDCLPYACLISCWVVLLRATCRRQGRGGAGAFGRGDDGVDTAAAHQGLG